MSPRKPPRVVFTNGCFDILHVGHTRYLRDARALGDLLVVGLNSDASVRRLKGPQRPIQVESDRAELLASLTMVDFVVVFDEDTPDAVIEKISPDILVKGGDWPVEKIAGSKFVLAKGGEVKSLPFHPGHSTTSLIERIDKR
jgi:rfaE bifunctional protein nucleotidyltransferase chain/domain